MGFYRQEYWSGLLFPSPGDLPNPGIKTGSLALQTDALPSEPQDLPAMRETWVQSLGQEDPLEKEIAAHSSTVAWKIPWLDLLAVQGTLKSLLQHHSSKASILRHSAFFTVQLPHPYMTTGKTIALTSWTLVGKVISLLFNMLSRLVINFVPRSKHLLM